MSLAEERDQRHRHVILLERRVDLAAKQFTRLRFQRDTWALLMDKLGKEKAAKAALKLDIPAPSGAMEAALSVQG